MNFIDLNKKVFKLERKLKCSNILFFTNFISFPLIGCINTLYIDRATNTIYLWDGINYQSTK